MSCGAPAGSEGFAPPLGQGGAAAQEMENFAAQVVTAAGTSVLANGAHNLRFSASDNETVAWTSGNITDNTGLTYAVDAGSVTAAALTYVYFDTALSTTVLQTTTDPADTVGTGKMLVAITENTADATKLARFQVIGTPDFSNVWSGAQIIANTLTAAHVASLVFTGKTANFDTGTVGGWTMASGTLSSGNVTLSATAERILLGSASAPLTGIGVFLGKDGAAYEFRAGDPANDYIHWDGSALTVVGNITATTISAASGTVGGWTISASALTSGALTLKSTAEQILVGSATDDLTGAGIFIGNDAGTYKFRVGDPAGQYLLWNGSALSLTGAIIQTANLVDGSVTTVKLGDAQVTESKIGASAVTEAKIGAAAVTTTKLGDTSVTEAKLGASSVTTTKIGDGAITVVKHASGLRPVEVVAALGAAGTQGRTVFLTTDNKLYRDTGAAWVATVPTTDLTGTIDLASQVSGELTEAFAAAGLINSNVTINADGTLTGAGGGQASLNSLPGTIATAQLEDDAVTTAKITALAVTAAELASDAVTEAKILNDAVTTAKIAALAVTAAELASDAVTEGKILNGAVTTTKIGALAVTTTKIAAGAVTSTELGNASVTEAKVGALAITEAKIAAGAVTSTKLGDTSVTEAKLGAGAVTEAKIGAGAVTTAKIGDSQVTTGKIGDSQITTIKIGDTAITEGKIALGAVTPDTMGIPIRNNTGSTIAAGALVYVSGWDETNGRFLVTLADADVAGATAQLVMQASLATSTNGTAFRTHRLTGVNTAGSAVGNPVYLSTTAGGWTLTAPTGATSVQQVVGRVAIVNAATGVVEFELADSVNIRFGTNNLQDSAIVADKIAAGTIVASKIAAGTITANEIAAATILAANIVSGTITTTQIASNTIVAGNIAAATITGAKIAAGTITASNITAGTITTTEIAALTITAANIAAGTITGAKIAATTITASNIVAGTITTTQIAANTIVAGNIAAGTITSTEIAAATIVAGDIASGTITTTQIAANTIVGGNISSLSVSGKSCTFDTGTVGGWTMAAGTLSSGSVTISATAERILMGSATAPSTGTGVFLGKDGLDYEFRVGDPTGDYIHWNGSAFTIAGDLIATANLQDLAVTGDKIAANTITAANITAGTITTTEIAATTITGTNISSLSISGKSITADTGTIGGWTLAAAELSSGSVKIQATAERILMGSATAPETGVGVFLGKDGSDYEFRAGDPTGEFIHWNGTNLLISGTIAADSILITDSTSSVKGTIDVGTLASGIAIIGGTGGTQIQITDGGIRLDGNASGVSSAGNTYVGNGKPGLDAVISAHTFSGALIEHTSGTHARASLVELAVPSITAGAASVTRATTLYIAGAPAAVGATNLALWVDAGDVQFDGGLYVSGGVQANTVTIVSAGTSGAPALAIADSNLGLWRPGGGIIAASAGGVEVWRGQGGYMLTGGETTTTNMVNGDIRCRSALWIKDAIAAPTATAGYAVLYVDSADGDLKVKFADGTTRIIASD